MDIKRFKKNMEIYGADFSRWSDISSADLEAFIASSQEAQSLYEKAKKLDKVLDSYNIEDASPELLASVTEKTSKKTGGNVIYPPSFFRRKPVWAAMAASAAAVFLFFAVPPLPITPMAPVDTEAELDIFLSEILLPVEEESEDVLSFFKFAEDNTATEEQEVEDFLDTLLLPEETSEGPVDIWDAFLAPDTERL